jgi:quinohemoprotein ethanol dehydrogenase
MSRRNVILALGMVWTHASLGAPPALPMTAAVDENAIGLYQQAVSDWLSNGRTYSEQRYSPLTQIDTGNVSRLGLAWQASLQSTMFGIEATPIVANGVLYTTSSYSRVFAFDAKTGTPLWSFDPKVARDRIRYGCCFPVNRGVALWKGKIYVAAYDGRLIALDAASGSRKWEVNTTGDAPYYTITGAPRVADGKVIIGNGGSDFGTRGFLSAYDAETGRLAWRFYVVPDRPGKPLDHPDLAIAAPTWSADRDWSKGGDGNPWDSLSYDPESKLVYVGTGNGGWLDQPHNAGKGDQLFVSSILAIHVQTGRLAWYYQTTPGDIWDYDATQNMVLTAMDIGGHSRKVLMQASKNGFFYVLDRVTGKLLSATKYVRVDWAKGVDPKTGRPIVNPSANYMEEPRHVLPSANGGHNWPGMAFDPQRGLAFIPARDSGFIYSFSVPAWYEHANNLAHPPPDEVVKQEHGALIAWDPVRRKPAWQVLQKTLTNGGVLATGGGLVAQGTQDGHLRFYSAGDGRLLHQVFTGTGIVAPPVTYAVGGVQYVAFQTGWNGFNTNPVATDAPERYVNDARLIVLKLDGTAVPVAARAAQSPFLSVDSPMDPKLVLKGAGLYLTYCAICHGHFGEQVLVPDLRRMSQGSYDNFDRIVLGGLLKDAGMAAFGDVLHGADTAAIRAFIADWAQRSRRNDPSASKMPITLSGDDTPHLPGH